jgi:O-antigen/teichoic acid export membrane protein
VTISKERQLGNAAIYLVPTILGNVIPLVTLPIFTRILTPHDYGAWALATVYAVFATGLANFGLTICYERNFFQYRDTPQEAALLYSVLVFVAGSYAVCVGLTWCFRGAIAQWLIGDAALGPLLFWTCCANGIASFKAYYLTYLRNTAQASSYVWFTIDETLLTTVFSLALVAYFRVGIIGLPWGQFTAAAIVLTLVTMRFVRRLKPAFSLSLLRESLRLSYPLTPRIFLNVVGNNFDKYVIGLLASVGSVGVYAIGQKVSYLVFGYMTALENVFAPQVYERMFKMGAEGGRSIGRYLTPFAYVSVAMAVLVSLFSEEALTLLTPAAYHGAVPVVNILVLYYAIMFFGKQPQLLYAKKTYLLSVLTIVGLVTNFGLNVICVRLFGTVGAALGTLIAGCASVGAYNLVARRFYRIEWETGKLAAIFGTLLVCSVVTVWLRNASVSYWVRLATKLALCGAYLWLGTWLSVVSRQNFELARGLVVRRLRPSHATML